MAAIYNANCQDKKKSIETFCRETGYTQKKAVIRRKKKIAAATYLYQADCDGEWGEIYIEFVNKTAKIIQLADWDLNRSRVYARTAIRYLISTGGRNLPKKRRVIFEPQKPPRRQHNRKFDVPNINKAGC